MTMTTSPPQATPGRSQHGHHAEHALFWVAVLAAGDFLGALFGHPWPVQAGVGMALAWLVVMACALSVYRGGPVAWPVVLGSVAGVAWASQALAFTVWSRYSLEALALCVVAFWLWLWLALGRQADWASQVARREAERNARLDAGKWPRILARAGFHGITTHTAPTEPQDGVVVTTLKLPASGKVTFSMLDQGKESIEIAAGLRVGAVTFTQDLDDSSLVKLQVSEVDRLKLIFPYPGETTNLSINNPFGIGVRETGDDFLIRLREVAAYVVGLRGMGKSNFINVLVAQLARMPDVLIFMYDGKGGRTGVPWIKAWLEKKCARPIIDWLAVDRDEAEKMLAACVRGQESRSRQGAGRNAKVTPSALTPAIILIVEEMAFIFSATYDPGYVARDGGASNTQLATLATRIVELARSEAIDPVLVTRRGTADNFGLSMLKSQIGLRIGFGVGDPNEASYAMGSSVATKLLARMRWPGAGVVRKGEGDVTAYKGWFLEDPERIYAHAAACGDRRPAPDPALADALGHDYATRWSRFPADILTNLGVRLAPAVVRELAERQLSEEAEFEKLIAENYTTGTSAPAAHPAEKVTSKATASEYIRERGVKGATVHQIYEHLNSRGLGVDKSTIHRWLNEWVASAVIVKPDETLPRYVWAQFARKRPPAA
jgi:hypothetical protein